VSEAVFCNNIGYSPAGFNINKQTAGKFFFCPAGINIFVDTVRVDLQICYYYEFYVTLKNTQIETER